MGVLIYVKFKMFKKFKLSTIFSMYKLHTARNTDMPYVSEAQHIINQ